MTLGFISDSEAFLLQMESVSDWTDSGLLIKTSGDAANNVITR